ncbi:amino acid transporter [Aspergillus pseudoustus]|uniref:Amino acid transporter n=1 Tax=Aspergillus pseudoustus TaxID=1810923 RepID=A0ABR4KLG5_9EURO
MTTNTPNQTVHLNTPPEVEMQAMAGTEPEQGATGAKRSEENPRLPGRPKQQLDRYLNFIASLAFSTTLLASWETVGGSLLAGLYNGGPSAIVYGLIVSIVGNLAIALSLAELASVHPTAGAQYHWTYVFSWSALVCIAPFFIGTQMEGLIILANPTYTPHRWHGTLLMWAVSIIPIVTNVFARRLLSGIELAAGVMHVAFLPIFIGVVAGLAPARSADGFVWDTLVSGLSGWKGDGLVFSIGLLGVITPFAGIDGIIHMSEEVHNAPRAIPRSMIWGTVINGIMAFGYTLCILYYMGPYLSAVVTPTSYPIIEIAYQATGGSVRGTALLMALGMLPGWTAFFNALASVTRLVWAFARDEGLPFSGVFVRVHETLRVPVRALGLVSAVVVLLSFIPVASTAAFNAILSLSTLGLYTSYLFPLGFLVGKRVFGAPGDVPKGQFSMGRWGLVVNMVAILVAMYFSLFLPFPPTVPITMENMNYAGPVLGLVMLFACVDWVLRGRYRWTGPTMEYARG